jgi:hypothetical protein
MSVLIRVAILTIGGYYLFQNRYKVISAFMSVQFVRKFVVSTMMKIPGLREKFIHQAFRA